MSKKMLNTIIVESDAFLDMPLTAQSLYMHLNMNADNDGFVNPRRVMRMIGAAQDDLMILITKRFILAFDSGVVVIKHWWINNTKRNDRYAPTTRQNELSELALKSNNSYTKNVEQLVLETGVGKKMATKRQEFLPQHNIIQHNIIQHNDSLKNKRQAQKPAAKNSKAYKKFMAEKQKLGLGKIKPKDSKRG